MGNTSKKFFIDVMALHVEVTGSCILLTVKFPNNTTKKILFDCGLFQEAEYGEYNKNLPFDPEKIDCVIVTHNHVDHTGRLPLLVKKGYRGPIYTSVDTSNLLKNALYDSYKVLKKRAELANDVLLYTDTDVDKTLSLVQGIEFNKSVYIEKDKNIKFTFFPNGHLPGAVITLLQAKYVDHDSNLTYDPINILNTGDYNNNNMFFDVPPLPKWVYQLPISIIQEATYGYMDSCQINEVFEENLLEAIAEKKEVVIPVFSLGRSQELMYILKKLQDSKKLDTDIPIYFDGKLGQRYTDLYISGTLNLDEKAQDFLPTNFTYVTESTMREDLISKHGCKIILTTSGMGSHGPAQTYLPAFLKNKNALIHFTGYLAEGTLGRRLFDSESNSVVDISGLQVKKRADVKFTSEFSAHAKADELIDFLRPFEQIQMVLINHGETSSKTKYSQRVIDEIDPKYIGILSRDYLFRLNAYGFEKSMSTKI